MARPRGAGTLSAGRASRRLSSGADFATVGREVHRADGGSGFTPGTIHSAAFAARSSSARSNSRSKSSRCATPQRAARRPRADAGPPAARLDLRPPLRRRARRRRRRRAVAAPRRPAARAHQRYARARAGRARRCARGAAPAADGADVDAVARRPQAPREGLVRHRSYLVGASRLVAPLLPQARALGLPFTPASTPPFTPRLTRRYYHLRVTASTHYWSKCSRLFDC